MPVDVNLFKDLTPMSDELVDPDGSYCKSIDWAINNANVHNIALTGSYGSGKSSIIQRYISYLRNGANKKYSFFVRLFKGIIRKNHKSINISLLSLDVNFSDKSSQKIQQGILQQLIYTHSPTRTPFSRFQRIKHISWMIIAMVSLILTAFCFLLFKSFDVKLNPIRILTILFGGFVFFILLDSIVKKFKISNLSIGKGKTCVEISPNKNESIFNKYLEEIIYFFQRTKYDIVIFEDIDRFNNKNVFIELRELNRLLNENKDIIKKRKDKKITFIYAIKDDMFKNNERTKFFDFIIPVVPIITCSNSDVKFKEMIKKAIPDEFSNEMDELIKSSSIYLDDYRTINNICNEFIIYRDKVQCTTDLSPVKMLAIIIYKNLCPDDFAKLQINKGKMYYLFVEKSNAISDKQKKICNNIDLLKNKIDSIEDELFSDIKELKAAFVGNYDFTNYHNTSSNYISIKNCGSSSIFAFINGDYTFNEITNICVNGNLISSEEDKLRNIINKFNQKVQIIQDKNSKEKLEVELHNLHEQFCNVKLETVSTLINSEDILILDDTPKIVTMLLSRGYIDESYENYLTYFHEGDLLINDAKYISNLRSNKTNLETEITNPPKVIEKMIVRDFASCFWFNYEIYTELILNSKKYTDKYTQANKVVCNSEINSIKFIYNYLQYISKKESQEEKQNLQEIFMKILFVNIDLCWQNIFDNKVFSLQDKRGILVLVHKYCSIDIIKQNSYVNGTDDEDVDFQTLKEFMLEQQDYLDLTSDVFIDKEKKIIEEVDMRFTCLDISSQSENRSELCDYIFTNNHFAINYKMIRNALLLYTNFSDEDINTKNYTCILESKQQWLFDYINYVHENQEINNIDYYIENVMLTLKSNTEESEKTVISLLNKDNVSIQNKTKVIQTQNVIILDLFSVSKSSWDDLIKYNKIKPTLDNVALYFATKSYDNLLRFLENHISEILESDFSERVNTELRTDFLQYLINNSNNFCKDRNEQIYENSQAEKVSARKIFIKIVEISKGYGLIEDAQEYEKLEKDYIHILIKNKLIKFTLDNFIYFNQKEDYQKELILTNKKEFEELNNDINKMNASSYIAIIESEINDQVKRNIIERFIEGCSDDIDCINCTANYVIHYWIEELIPELIVNELLENLLDNTLKAAVILKQSKYISKDEIIDLLRISGDPFDRMFILHQQPKICVNSEVEALLNMLKDNNIISSYTCKDDEYVVYPKQC